MKPGTYFDGPNLRIAALEAENAALAARVVALEKVVKAADALRESVVLDDDPIQLVRDLYRYEAARAKLEDRA